MPPWNAGRAVGQKKAFTIAQARELKARLTGRMNRRDLALASLAFDSSLRSCDLLGLRWEQLLDGFGRVKTRVTVRQQKTRANVTVGLSSQTRSTLEDLYRAERGEFVFSGQNGEKALSGRQYRRLVKRWARMLGISEEDYGTHSLRRTKPAAVYEKTRDAEVARILLGQQSLLATHRYLGLGAEDALAKAREIEI